jgi:hypothetical protein
MSSKNGITILALAALLFTSACGANSLTQPADNATTFHVTDKAARVLPGVAVCSGSTCATTNATGDASLALRMGVQTFVSFTVPSQPIAFGNLYTPNGQVITVPLALQ